MICRPARVAPLLVSLLALAALPAGAADWTVDPAASALGFSGTQAGAPFEGRFGAFDAAIAFDPDDPAASRIVVTIDMTSAVTGDPVRDQALPQPEWFDTARHPTARFASDSVRRRDGDRYEAAGTLTIKGVAEPVTLPFSLTIAGDRAHAAGALTIDRTRYAVGTGPWASGAMVGLPVTITVDLTARRTE